MIPLLKNLFLFFQSFFLWECFFLIIFFNRDLLSRSRAAWADWRNNVIRRDGVNVGDRFRPLQFPNNELIQVQSNLKRQLIQESRFRQLTFVTAWSVLGRFFLLCFLLTRHRDFRSQCFIPDYRSWDLTLLLRFRFERWYTGRSF